MLKVLKKTDSTKLGMPAAVDLSQYFLSASVFRGLISHCSQLLLTFCGCFLLTLPTLAQEPDTEDCTGEKVAQEEVLPPKDPVPQPLHSGVDIARDAKATSLSEPNKNGLKVLILGDSMALSGFADTLDECFRSCPGVTEVHTVICCGTNPLSWLKAAPYTYSKTRCGFIEIKSTAEGVKAERDIYGMTKGHKPSAHVVPKIEDMVSELKPDIIVFQCGNNFFDLFKKGEATNERSVAVLRAHVSPLVTWLKTNAPSVKKWYWVSPPQAGNVTPAVQAFIFDTIKLSVDGYAVMLDSREITSYPYRMQDRDKMHFWGQACNDWGRDTFRLIAKDLAEVDVANLPSLVYIAAARALAGDTTPATPVAPDKAKETLRLRVKLAAMTKLPAPEEFTKAYGEYLVGYLYDVVEVKSGTYLDKQLLLLHPLYIKLVRQDLSHLKVGQTYDVEVIELADTDIWISTNKRDTVGSSDLFPHMLVEDFNRHPDSIKKSEIESATKNTITP